MRSFRVGWNDLTLLFLVVFDGVENLERLVIGLHTSPEETTRGSPASVDKKLLGEIAAMKPANFRGSTQMFFSGHSHSFIIQRVTFFRRHGVLQKNDHYHSGQQKSRSSCHPVYDFLLNLIHVTISKKNLMSVF